ncbi:hypothetical protein AGMMS49579_03800 [Spirochaetia bacterium]|nr:hypothetical protein AGMMS49579_03800 [Spirochaetia bacterium]
MDDYKLFVTLDCLKHFCNDLCSCYKDKEKDINLHYFKQYLDCIKIMEEDKEEIEIIISALNNFFDLNKDIENNGDNITGIIKYDDQRFIDVPFYIGKNDGNKTAILSHLKNIKDINNFKTKEEIFFKNCIEKLRTSNISSLENMVTTIKQKNSDNYSCIQESIEEFKNGNFEQNRIIKILCFTAKEFLKCDDLPSYIAKNKTGYEKLINYLIKNNLEEITDFSNLIEILSIISSSGLLNHAINLAPETKEIIQNLTFSKN